MAQDLTSGRTASESSLTPGKFLSQVKRNLRLTVQKQFDRCLRQRLVIDFIKHDCLFELIDRSTQDHSHAFPELGMQQKKHTPPVPKTKRKRHDQNICYKNRGKNASCKKVKHTLEHWAEFQFLKQLILFFLRIFPKDP